MVPELFERVDDFDDSFKKLSRIKFLTVRVSSKVCTHKLPQNLHNTTRRMKVKGVIKVAVPWARSGEFFFYLTQRRILKCDCIGNSRIIIYH